MLHPPGADPGITDDERRTIAEMMAKGTYASIILATNDLDGTFEQAPGHATPRSSRSPPTSRTASATAPSAIPRATWSASTRCAELATTCDHDEHLHAPESVTPHVADSHDLIRVTARG